MSKAGMEVRLDDAEYRNIIEALDRASHCNLKRIAQAAGLALEAVTAEAFKKQEDPVRGDKWEALKTARGPLAAKPGSKTPILTERLKSPSRLMPLMTARLLSVLRLCIQRYIKWAVKQKPIR